MSLKINAYLRSSLSDDAKDANSILSGEVLMLTEALSGVAGVTKLIQSEVDLKTQSPILVNQSYSSYTYKDELKIESEGTDCFPDVSAPHPAPMIQSPNFRSMSPFASESIPNLDSSDSPSPSSDMHSSKSKSRNREKPAGICKVCGDIATGKYFGALVCVPCKTFFLRYNGEGFSFVCKNKQVCDISVSTRIQCKYCRFQKCLSAGMTRKVRPPQVEPKEGKQLCVVCNDFGNGVHFGVVTCEGCKKFFRRGLVEHKTYVCKFSKCCPINPQTRNTCRYCRYNKCKSLGMSREAIQMGRPSKASQKHGILRSTEQQFDDNEDMVDVDRSNDEESAPSHALDLSITPSSISSFVSQSSPFPATSVGVRRAATDSSETLHFTFLPPSLRQNICLSANEISNQIVPFQLLNEAQQTVFQNLRRQAERNHMNSRNSQSPPKRITMLDLVAMFGEDKINTKLWGSRKSNERTKIKPQESSSCSNDPNEVDDFVIEHKMRTRLNISKSYWLASLSPDENLHVSDEKHLEIINMIVPNYGEFVSSSETINHNLTNNYREWVIQNGQNMNAAVVSEWIKTSVIPAFTIISVKYCKQIPGFKSFDMTDQVKIACLGQSPSRILAAVLHWFDPVINNFKDFLSWRDRIPGNTDRFKKYLIGFANNVQLLNMDAVEAAILNALIIIASDYPDLIDHKVIESARTQIICTFRAYITVKYGASSDRLDKLFGIIPEIRKIGFFHHEMTNKKTMMAEEFGERLLKSFNL